MSKIEVNTVDVQCGSSLTLGSSGKTVTLAAGASQSGFGRTGRGFPIMNHRVTPPEVAQNQIHQFPPCVGTPVP